jgi:2'-5' RNA ligase
MTHLRTFIAIDLPKSIQDSIEKEVARLQKLLSSEIIRWTPLQNIHITLKFLGDTPTMHIDFLKQMLTRLCDSHSAFDLQLSTLGSFPNAKLPRILWLGLHAPTGLASLQRDIENESARLGYEKEARAFSPHLTIGRVHQNIHPNDLQKIASILSTFQLGKIGSARVDSVHHYQSDLHTDGSVYTKLFSAKLK